MNLKVKETMEKFGAKVLTDEQLISIILGNEKKMVNILGRQDLFVSEQESALEIIARPYDEVKYRGQLTNMEAMRITAAVELGIRICEQRRKERLHISSPSDAATFLMTRMARLTHEIFVVMALDTKNRVICTKQISEGSLSCAVVHPREVFTQAMIAHAAAIICGHNHPSGEPHPSGEDKNLTKILAETGKIMGIPLLDHVVIGDGRYYSFKEHGDI